MAAIGELAPVQGGMVPERGSEVASRHRCNRDGFDAVASVATEAAAFVLPQARFCAPAPSSARLPNIVNIAPPQPDGGTSFRCGSEVTGWPSQLQRLLTLRTANLPAEVTLTCGDGSTITAIVKAGHRHGGRVKLLFAGEAQLDLYPNGDVYLEADAHGLWTAGFEAWLTTWLERASLWFLGASCPSPAHARAFGWSTWKLELAADFTGFALYIEDMPQFIGRAKPVLVGSEGFKDGQVETVTCSKRRRHCLSVSIHDKSQALAKVGKVRADQSVYYATWKAHGYDGSSRIRRVEVRASGDALHLHSSKRCRKQEAAASELDLRDPAALLDPQALGRFWRHGTEKYRLAAPAANKKVRARPTDPRWEAVQAAGGTDEGVEYAVVDRESASRLSIDHLVAQAERSVAREQAKLQQLRQRQRVYRGQSVADT